PPRRAAPTRVDRPGVEPGFPACHAGVLSHWTISPFPSSGRRPGVEPGLPVCKTSALPLDERPILPPAAAALRQLPPYLLLRLRPAGALRRRVRPAPRQGAVAAGHR